jgi:hypothetical protein
MIVGSLSLIDTKDVIRNLRDFTKLRANVLPPRPLEVLHEFFLHSLENLHVCYSVFFPLRLRKSLRIIALHR